MAGQASGRQSQWGGATPRAENHLLKALALQMSQEAHSCLEIGDGVAQPGRQR